MEDAHIVAGSGEVLAKGGLGEMAICRYVIGACLCKIALPEVNIAADGVHPAPFDVEGIRLRRQIFYSFIKRLHGRLKFRILIQSCRQPPVCHPKHSRPPVMNPLNPGHPGLQAVVGPGDFACSHPNNAQVQSGQHGPNGVALKAVDSLFQQDPCLPGIFPPVEQICPQPIMFPCDHVVLRLSPGRLQSAHKPKNKHCISGPFTHASFRHEKKLGFPAKLTKKQPPGSHREGENRAGYRRPRLMPNAGTSFGTSARVIQP